MYVEKVFAPEVFISPDIARIDGYRVYTNVESKICQRILIKKYLAGEIIDRAFDSQDAQFFNLKCNLRFLYVDRH